MSWSDESDLFPQSNDREQIGEWPGIICYIRPQWLKPCTARLLVYLVWVITVCHPRNRQSVCPWPFPVILILKADSKYYNSTSSMSFWTYQTSQERYEPTLSNIPCSPTIRTDVPDAISHRVVHSRTWCWRTLRIGCCQWRGSWGIVRRRLWDIWRKVCASDSFSYGRGQSMENYRVSVLLDTVPSTPPSDLHHYFQVLTTRSPTSRTTSICLLDEIKTC